MLSWCAYNWRIWVYALDTSNAAAKIRSIASQIERVQAFACPLGIAVALVLVPPFLQVLVSWLISKARILQLKVERVVREAENDATRAGLKARQAMLDALQERLIKESNDLQREKVVWRGAEEQRNALQSDIERLADDREQLAREADVLERYAQPARRLQGAVLAAESHLPALQSTDAATVRSAMDGIRRAFREIVPVSTEP